MNTIGPAFAWMLRVSLERPFHGRRNGLMSTLHQRCLPLGAEPLPSGGTHFRVWAPRRRRVEIVLMNGAATELSAEPDGYFSGRVERAQVGTLYRFRLDGSSD